LVVVVLAVRANAEPENARAETKTTKRESRNFIGSLPPEYLEN
jgi:hypothetical protein